VNVSGEDRMRLRVEFLPGMLMEKRPSSMGDLPKMISNEGPFERALKTTSANCELSLAKRVNFNLRAKEKFSDKTDMDWPNPPS
jgi:hypothetical protein